MQKFLPPCPGVTSTSANSYRWMHTCRCKELDRARSSSASQEPTQELNRAYQVDGPLLLAFYLAMPRKDSCLANSGYIPSWRSGMTEDLQNSCKIASHRRITDVSRSQRCAIAEHILMLLFAFVLVASAMLCEHVSAVANGNHASEHALPPSLTFCVWLPDPI